MSLASTITTFLIDVSPSMGALRIVAEDVEDANDQEEATRLDEGDRVRAEDGMDGELNDADGSKRTLGEWKVRERETSNLQWACEFVGRRVQTYVHAGLKTGKVCLITYGSATTNNAVAGDGTTKQEYLGINEMFSPAQPDLNTCELVRALRASKDSEEPHRADPLDALIAAICTLTDKDRGGINSSSKNTWTRTIYLITDAMTKFNQDDSALIQQRLEEENIQLKVIGIDFDDEEFGYVEEDKPLTKAKNEQFWHDFLSRVPGSGIATAADVIEQTHMPQLAPKKSAAQNATLTFGDPEEQHLSHEVLGIAVVLYKATTLVRPMSAKKLSKIAQQSAAGKAEMERAAQMKIEPSSAPKLQPNQELEGSNPAFIDGEAHAMSYGVDMVRKYFILDEIRQLPEEEMDSAQPLPEGSEENFIKAWKLGKSHIPVEQVQDVVFATQAGLEIIQFHNREQLRRWFVMGETSYVLASPGNGEAQLKVSALVKAMIELGKIALVRNVKKRDADPKLAALIPIPKDPESGSEADHFVYAEMPFANDFKRLVFPPLEYVADRNGVEHREHHLLPTREMQSAMDDLVDSMDLMEAYEEPDGSRSEWFSTEDSFNPAIHRIKEAVEWRVFHPEDKELPKAHFELDKFLKRPETVWNKSSTLAAQLKDLFELDYSPDANIQRQEMFREQKRKREEEAAANAKKQASNGAEGKVEKKKGDGDDEEGDKTLILDENDDSATDEEEAQSARPSKATRAGSADRPTKTGAGPHRAQGDVSIGTNDPVADFRRALQDARDPAVVIRAMCQRIRQLVSESMASNSYGKARDSMKVCRAEAAVEDEAEEWNEFVRKFKNDLQQPTFGRRARRDFWDGYVRGMMEVGLITMQEDAGGRSRVDSKEAKDFVS